MYYLQSRYYNPALGRFLNADSYVSTGQGILGYNMFAYCNNNPVNSIDSGGTTTVALSQWICSMWWLLGIDGALPFGDLIFTLGFIVLSIETWDSIEGVFITQGSEDYSPPVSEYREHTKGARPSTKSKHQKGQTRKNRDNRGEKGDARRLYRGNKKKVRMVFLMIGDFLFEEDTTQVVVPGGPSSSGCHMGGSGRNICTVQMDY